MASSIVAQVEKAIASESLAEFVRENLSGENLSIRGVAGLCGVDDMSLIRGADFSSAKLAEKLTTQGFKGADLARNGFPPAAVWLTIEYFAYESKAEAFLAKAIARTFGAFGVKAAFKEISGEPVEAQAPRSPLSKLLEDFQKLGFDPTSPENKEIVRAAIANAVLGTGHRSSPEPQVEARKPKTRKSKTKRLKEADQTWAKAQIQSFLWKQPEPLSPGVISNSIWALRDFLTEDIRSLLEGMAEAELIQGMGTGRQGKYQSLATALPKPQELARDITFNGSKAEILILRFLEGQEEPIGPGVIRNSIWAFRSLSIEDIRILLEGMAEAGLLKRDGVGRHAKYSMRPSKASHWLLGS